MAEEGGQQPQHSHACPGVLRGGKGDSLERVAACNSVMWLVIA